LHFDGTPSRITGQAAQPVFDDTKNYFDPTSPGAGVKLPAVGVTIKVESVSGTSIKVKFGKSR
jgi:immune inhibitor A